jgi:hypothetical protein
MNNIVSFTIPTGISADFYELLTHPMEIPWQVLEIPYWFFD